MIEKEILTININSITKTHETVLDACNKIKEQFNKQPNTEIILDFTNCNFIYPDYSLLLLCTLKHIENNGISVTGKIIYNESKIISYLSRMNFFRNLNVDIPEKFTRLRSCKFVEIQKYNEDNQIEVLQLIMNVIKNNTCINDNVFASLDYCLNEILDNVLNHSEIKEGWVVAQYFGKLNCIRLIVSDNGVGIHQSLKKAYNYTEEESIIKSIEEGITNGLGQGHGLYATSSFTKLNKGWLSLISGNKKLDVSEHNTSIKTIPHWQGTCVYLRVNTNIDVDYKLFTSKHYDYKQELFESMFK